LRERESEREREREEAQHALARIVDAMWRRAATFFFF
jgi:hypothetical protein